MQEVQPKSWVPFAFGLPSRHVGDSFCWMVDLNTEKVPIKDKTFPSSILFGNTWSLDECRRPGRLPVFRVIHFNINNIMLRHPYTASYKMYNTLKKYLDKARDREFNRLTPEEQEKFTQLFSGNANFPTTEKLTPRR